MSPLTYYFVTPLMFRFPTEVTIYKYIERFTVWINSIRLIHSRNPFDGCVVYSVRRLIFYSS